MDACTVTAFDVITAFAVPNSNYSLRSRPFLAARQVTLPSQSPSLLRIGEILFKPNLFGVDGCQSKQFPQPCQCRFSVQKPGPQTPTGGKCNPLNYWFLVNARLELVLFFHRIMHRP